MRGTGALKLSSANQAVTRSLGFAGFAAGQSVEASAGGRFENKIQGVSAASRLARCARAGGWCSQAPLRCVGFWSAQENANGREDDDFLLGHFKRVPWTIASSGPSSTFYLFPFCWHPSPFCLLAPFNPTGRCQSARWCRRRSCRFGRVSRIDHLSKRPSRPAPLPLVVTLLISGSAERERRVRL